MENIYRAKLWQTLETNVLQPLSEFSFISNQNETAQTRLGSNIHKKPLITLFCQLYIQFTKVCVFFCDRFVSVWLFIWTFVIWIFSKPFLISSLQFWLMQSFKIRLWWTQTITPNTLESYGDSIFSTLFWLGIMLVSVFTAFCWQWKNYWLQSQY